MVTDFGSAENPQAVAPPHGGGDIQAPDGAGGSRSHGERFWSWTRFVILLLLAVGLGYWGYQLRPTADKPIYVSEPRISILANQPDVTAKVDMTLTSNLGQQTPYVLTLTITPANPGQDVTFAVSFGHFPAAAAGTGPLHGPPDAPYALIGSAPGLSGTVSLGKAFTYKSAQPIGENSEGAQLRVAFPVLMGEKPGAPVQNCGVAAGSLGAFSTICEQLKNQPQWVPPSLDAGATTFSSADPALGNYQYLAGDNPTLLGGDQWMWSGINDVQVLAVNLPAQTNGQNSLFWSGVLLGLAGGAGIASITEFFRPAWKREPESAAREIQEAPKTGT